MQLVINRNIFLKSLQQIIGFVEKKQTMPILSYIYLCKQGNILTLIANDMEIQLTILLREIEGDDVICTIHARKIIDVLRALPNDVENVIFRIIDNKLFVTAGNSKFNLQSLPAEQYPLLTINDNYLYKFTMSTKKLQNMLAKVHYAMALNDSRSFLNGMLLEIRDHGLILVGTDAHRLSYCKEQLDKGMNSDVVSCILPRKTMLELYRLLVNFEGEVTVTIYDNQVQFQLKDLQIISNIIDGKYPDYNRVIPVNNSVLCLIERVALLKAVQRVSVIGVDKLKTLVMKLDNNLLRLSCINEENEEAVDEIVIDYQGQTLQLNFNINYILDVLNNMHEDVLQWAFYDNQRSVLVTVPNDTNFKYVVMPLRA